MFKLAATRSTWTYSRWTPVTCWKSSGGAIVASPLAMRTPTRFQSTMSVSAVARIQKPAPNFRAEAVVNGEFKTISLSDYKGFVS